MKNIRESFAEKTTGVAGEDIALQLIQDKNANGKLDDEEKAAMKKDREAAIKKYDKNGDGKLDDAEKAAQKEDAKKKGDKKKKE